MRYLRRWRRHSRDEQKLFLLALFATSMVRASLLTLRLTVIRPAVNRYMRAAFPLPPHKRQSVEHIVWAVAAAARYSPVGTTCLASALVAQALFSRHGYHTCLRIGVRRDADGSFAAHAWVERDGYILVGGAVEVLDFTPLPAIDHLLV
jgi:hypothetical protein